MVRKNFYGKGNDAFVCENCGYYVTKLSGSFRNHCTECLHSKHVDVIAGDRLAQCQKLMPAVSVEQDSKRGWVITHECECGHTRRNGIAEDDNFDRVIELT